jgi:hypothetical protein
MAFLRLAICMLAALVGAAVTVGAAYARVEVAIELRCTSSLALSRGKQRQLFLVES